MRKVTVNVTVIEQRHPSFSKEDFISMKNKKNPESLAPQ